jgi:hypothetical protein
VEELVLLSEAGASGSASPPPQPAKKMKAIIQSNPAFLFIYYLLFSLEYRGVE